MRIVFLLLGFLAFIAAQTTPAPDGGRAGGGDVVGGNGPAAESTAPESSVVSAGSTASQISGSGVNQVSSLNNVAASVASSASRAGTAAITTGAADATVAGTSPKSDGNIARMEWKGFTNGVSVIMMGIVAGMLVI